MSEWSYSVQIERKWKCIWMRALMMYRITATAVSRMFVWQSQPRFGCEYHNRNRGYFFSTTAYILRNIYSRKSLFYLFWSSNCNYVIATYYLFFNRPKENWSITTSDHSAVYTFWKTFNKSWILFRGGWKEDIF